MNIFKYSDKLYTYSLIIIFILCILFIYYLYIIKDIDTNFFKLGYGEHIKFAHKTIDTEAKYIFSLLFCFIFGIIYEFFNKIQSQRNNIYIYHHKKLKTVSIISSIFNINKYLFNIIFIYIAMTVHFQFLFTFISGIIVCDILYIINN
jgi:hypothetical protein